jgi:hypothetical protein
MWNCLILLARAIASSSVTILSSSVTTTARREVAWPQDEDQRLAGTHSGFVTLLRVAAANDRFFPDGSDLWEYDATYKFNTLDDTPLQKGQITARGVLLFQGEDLSEPPVRFAITGGTGPFNTAHGTITEGVPTDDHRLLDIEL